MQLYTIHLRLCSFVCSPLQSSDTSCRTTHAPGAQPVGPVQPHVVPAPPPAALCGLPAVPPFCGGSGPLENASIKNEGEKGARRPSSEHSSSAVVSSAAARCGSGMRGQLEDGLSPVSRPTWALPTPFSRRLASPTEALPSLRMRRSFRLPSDRQGSSSCAPPRSAAPQLCLSAAGLSSAQPRITGLSRL